MHNYRNNVLNSIVRMYDLSPIVTLSSAERRSQDDSNVVDGDRSFPPVTCVVADGLLTWAIDAAEELGVLALAFRTSSACSFLAYQTVPELLERGELPFPEGDDLDEPVPAFRAWRASCVDRIFPVRRVRELREPRDHHAQPVHGVPIRPHRRRLPLPLGANADFVRTSVDTHGQGRSGWYWTDGCDGKA